MKKIIFCFLLLIVPLSIKGMEISGDHKSAVLVEVSTEEVLFEENGNERRAPASMTKIMTLLIIMETIEHGSLTYGDSVIISQNAANMGGSQLFLEANTTMKVQELIKGIAIASGNDAAVAMAEKIAGTEEEFVKMMNAKADDLGLKNTSFKNVHGLDEEGHYTSANDMAVMAMELVKYEDILKFTSTYEEYLQRPDGTEVWLVNTNKLVRYYDGVDGLKTGFTDDALYCITTTAAKEELRFITVVMGSSTSELRNKATTELLDYGFNNFKLSTILSKDYELGTINVEKGSESSAQLTLESDVTELLKTTEKSKEYSKKIIINNNVAPLKVGDEVGVLQLIIDGSVSKEIKITVKESVERRSFFESIFYVFKEIVSGKEN